MSQHTLTLHHVGYASGEIESLSDSYVKRFGYEIHTPVIHDPLQKALVQFLALPGDTTYLEVVSPAGPQSPLMNAVRKGGGLNHLCYMADDLAKAIDILVEKDMMLISPPKPAVAFGGRQICWLMGDDALPVELVERSSPTDRCSPGL